MIKEAKCNKQIANGKWQMANRIAEKPFTHSTAFTLAEVLITLVVIGIVSALTIPALINSYQKTEYVTGLKKAYSAINQALKQISIGMGCVDDLQCTGLFANGTGFTTLGDNLTKYFNIAKNCKTSTNLGCWNPTTNENYDGSSGTNYTYDSNGGYTFITADGMSFYIINNANNCNDNYSMGRTGNMTQTCGSIFIDVNGLKGPNFYGRDTFAFFITNGKGAILYPYGGADDNKSAGADSWWSDSSGGIRRCYSGNKYGVICAGRVMEENWQMNY